MSVKRNVGTLSELFRIASPISEGNGLGFSIFHEDEAKNRGFWLGPFVKPHRVKPFPSWTCPLLRSRIQHYAEMRMLSWLLRRRNGIFVRKGFKVSRSEEISQKQQQIEQSSDFQIWPQKRLKSAWMTRRGPKIDEIVKKLAWRKFQKIGFCSLKVPLIRKCGPFYGQNGEKCENVDWIDALRSTQRKRTHMLPRNCGLNYIMQNPYCLTLINFSALHALDTRLCLREKSAFVGWSRMKMTDAISKR